MSGGIDFFDGLIEERLTNLHTAMPCRVRKFNEANGTADIVPLFMRKFKGKPPQAMPMLINVPVIKRKYRKDGVIEVEDTVYESGDIVLVVFVERAMDG